MLKRSTVFSVILLLLGISAGCGRSDADNISGDYHKGKSSLKVTRDTMTASQGPMTFTINYKVTATDRDKITIEGTIAGDKRTINTTITRTADGLDIGGGPPLGGKWLK